jgi:hypothetical protein
MSCLSQATIRGWHLDQLRKNVAILHNILTSVSVHDATTYRDDGSGWTALEVMCHLRDLEAVIMQRATLTVEQESPALPNFDADATALAGRYNEQNLEAVYQAWVEGRTVLLAYLAERDEAAWERVGIHPKRGAMTLADQLAFTAWHDVNHIEQLVRILAEKKSA